jgi:hypothetical protein
LISRHIVLVVVLTLVLELQKHDDEDENDDEPINENKILVSTPITGRSVLWLRTGLYSFVTVSPPHLACAHLFPEVEGANTSS